MRTNSISLKLILVLSILFYGFSTITCSECAQAMNICIDDNGKTIFTNNVCPDGYQLKGEKGKKQDSSAVEDKKEYTTNQILEWDNYQIVVKDIKMSWQLVEDRSQKEPIYYPKMEFKVINNSKETIRGLKIILKYIKGSDTFGETSQYLKDIEADGDSLLVSMWPEKGYTYTGFNEDAITDNTFKVLVYGRYNGEKEEMGAIDYYSKKTVKKAYSKSTLPMKQALEK